MTLKEAYHEDEWHAQGLWMCVLVPGLLLLIYMR